MKVRNAELELRISGGRIADAIVMENGTCKLVVTMNESEDGGEVVEKKSNVPDENAFVLIEASQLSLDDEFMKHRPSNDSQRIFRKLLTKAIRSGLSDFWVPKFDPSFNEDETGLVYKVGKIPAVGKSFNWWEEKAIKYLPERDSHLGTKKERVAFLGVLIKKMVADGWTVPKAWMTVCYTSKELGHYLHSKNAKHYFETTGSREVCSFCDLANTYKILEWDEEVDGFWLSGGSYSDYDRSHPLANFESRTSLDSVIPNGVGWIVLSK